MISPERRNQRRTDRLSFEIECTIRRVLCPVLGLALPVLVMCDRLALDCAPLHGTSPVLRVPPG